MSDPAALAFNCAESVHPVATHYAPRRALVGVRQAFGHLADLPSALPPVNLRLMLRGVPRHRVILIGLLSLLLLFLQQESVRHQLDHPWRPARARQAFGTRAAHRRCLPRMRIAGGRHVAALAITARDVCRFAALDRHRRSAGACHDQRAVVLPKPRTTQPPPACLSRSPLRAAFPGSTWRIHLAANSVRAGRIGIRARRRSRGPRRERRRTVAIA
jgi:hypothetical protein